MMQPPLPHRLRSLAATAGIILIATIALAPTISSNFSLPSFGSSRTYSNKDLQLALNPKEIRFPLSMPADETLRLHIQRTMAYIYRNINPETSLAYSFPGDRRLRYWSVIYDDCMRTIAHIRTGDIAMAKRTIDYFMENQAIQKVGWVYKHGKRVARPGWTVNIVDAAESRSGGRGIEHIAHTGPNAYLGIASLHLYRATNDKKYLQFARNRWQLIKDLQNENPDDFNYGGVRMGPMGSEANPQEQKLNFVIGNPSFYDFYNGEHAADFKALSDLLAKIDKPNRKEYERASHLITVWDHRIYDPQNHLFFIGTTDKAYYENNIGQWVGPGVIHMYPLDTSALKICAYGVKGLEEFEPDAAEKIRAAIEKNFKVNVTSVMKDRAVSISGYDFVTDEQRKHLVMFEEQGINGDYKVKRGVGRIPLLSDEWSTWVSFADLRLAKDFQAQGNHEKAARYMLAYKTNSLIEGLKSADPLDETMLAYPYVHPMNYGFNKPVGFGWNTHHQPYSMIGGVARVLGIMGADPFSFDDELISVHLNPKSFRLAPRLTLPPSEGLVTEAEVYVNKAWEHVRQAQKRGPDEPAEWEAAADIIERMLSEHPDWQAIAKNQNKLAAKSGDEFPLMGISNVAIQDLEPIYRKYWALYHIGTGQFIRVMAYSELAQIGKSRNDLKMQWENKAKARSAADQIVRYYFYAQSYDKTGWLWQPVLSLREYIEGYDVKL